MKRIYFTGSPKQLFTSQQLWVNCLQEQVCSSKKHKLILLYFKHRDSLSSQYQYFEFILYTVEFQNLFWSFKFEYLNSFINIHNGQINQYEWILLT